MIILFVIAALVLRVAHVETCFAMEWNAPHSTAKAAIQHMATVDAIAAARKAANCAEKSVWNARLISENCILRMTRPSTTLMSVPWLRNGSTRCEQQNTHKKKKAWFVQIYHVQREYIVSTNYKKASTILYRRGNTTYLRKIKIINSIFIFKRFNVK